MTEQVAASMPPIPVTGQEMAVRWAQRDAEYAKNRTGLDPDTINSIRQARMAEASRLPDVKERARMFAKAQTWQPPRHPDFGSIRDWLS